MDEEKAVRIAEKVKFWEEQDKINQSLIPRVLKNHDLIKENSERTLKISESFLVIQNDFKFNQSKQNQIDEKINQMNELFDNSADSLEKLSDINETIAFANESHKKHVIKSKRFFILLTIWTLINSIVTIFMLIN